MQSKIRPIQDINKEIAEAKNVINVNEGHLASQMNKYSTPQKQRAQGSANTAQTTSKTPETNPKYQNESQKELSDEKIANYIKNLKKLCTSLQQKSYALEVDYRKNLLSYQYKLDQYKAETINLKAQLEQATAQNKQADKRLKQFQKIVKQQQELIANLNQELSKFRTDNVQLKLQNKTYKADNKVIMNHLDRLNNQKKNPANSASSLQERQLRVIKSIYQSPAATYEQGQAIKRYNDSSQLSNKVMLEEAIDKNGELKRLISKLNEEIQILKRQKQVLAEECRLKAENLQAQKMIAKMNEESNERLNGIIMKMGQKIMNLEYLNQTLKSQLAKSQGEDESTDQNYYKTTKSKAGQFYYKK